MSKISCFQCFQCKKKYSTNTSQMNCECGGLFEVFHDWSAFSPLEDLKKYKNHSSGVWRFLPLIYPEIHPENIITRGEGYTGVYKSPQKLVKYAGTNKISFKHEGENPTGSFKDRGMTVGITEAKNKNSKAVICASTGNTSASLAAYSAYANLRSVVVIPKGKISHAKLAQALAYGAEVYQSDGTFDNSLEIVQQLANQESYYLLNSINPWRIEGQKTIIFELLEHNNWEIPDWIVIPAGNLSNTSAFGKALKEAQELELIHELPRIVSVQAEGAKPFVNYWNSGVFTKENSPQTIATAINIGNPFSVEKGYQTLKFTNGLALSVSDQEIVDAKAMIDQAGIGCEPASAATLAGIKKLIEDGSILPSEEIVTILTGHLLKNPQFIIDYHSHSLNNLNSTFENEFRSVNELITV